MCIRDRCLALWRWLGKQARRFDAQVEYVCYTQYGYIRTTVNVSVLVVLTFSQNFSTNGPYVVLNFCKFSDYMVLIFEKKILHCILCISDR